MESNTLIQRETETLESLLVCLREERDAIARLDPVGIDKAAEQKRNIDEALIDFNSQRSAANIALEETDKTRYIELLHSIRPLARHNARGLQTAQKTIRGLIGAMTGADQHSYGPKNAPVASVGPILTSSIG
jgi:hypothetical protein